MPGVNLGGRSRSMRARGSTQRRSSDRRDERHLDARGRGRLRWAPRRVVPRVPRAVVLVARAASRPGVGRLPRRRPRPAGVRAVVGMSVPFVPRAPMPPTQLFRAMSGDSFFYILYFQEVGPADRELAADPKRTLARVFYSVSAFAPPGAVRRLPREGTSYL